MLLNLLNSGQRDLPITIVDGKNADVQILEAGISFYVDDTSTVVIVGQKPDLEDQLKAAGQAILDMLRKIIDTLTMKQGMSAPDGPEDIALDITNGGSLPVRVIMPKGYDGVEEVTMSPGGTYLATAKGYVELRELGHVQEQDDPGKQNEQTIA